MTRAIEEARQRLQNLVMHALAADDSRELYGLLAEIRGEAWEAMYECRLAWRAVEPRRVRGEFTLEDLGL